MYLPKRFKPMLGLVSVIVVAISFAGVGALQEVDPAENMMVTAQAGEPLEFDADKQETSGSETETNDARRTPSAVEQVADWAAVAAILLALFIGWQTRQHYRRSVKPLLSFDTIATGEDVGLRLTNGGLGPAIVRSVGLKLDGEAKEWSQIVEFVRSKVNLPVSAVDIVYVRYDEGDTIRQGESDFLIRVKRSDITKERAEAVNLLVEKTTVTIKYQSLYQRLLGKDEVAVWSGGRGVFTEAADRGFRVGIVVCCRRSRKRHGALEARGPAWNRAGIKLIAEPTDF